ncbi:MAG: hypothetical protein RID09_21700 [Coleofasciculus sp. G1-WW12-02]|uniref:hypothetical protein n=1 Tax=unclassified Coleofasciculus TaxID=2692782 RepID=UPI0032F77983
MTPLVSYNLWKIILLKHRNSARNLDVASRGVETSDNAIEFSANRTHPVTAERVGIAFCPN